MGVGLQVVHVGEYERWVIIKVSGHQHRWLAGGYDLEIQQGKRTFLEVDSMVVT